MIPKAVADRLRKGITALETCQVQDRAVNKDSGTQKPQNIKASGSEKWLTAKLRPKIFCAFGVLLS